MKLLEKIKSLFKPKCIKKYTKAEKKAIKQEVMFITTLYWEWMEYNTIKGQPKKIWEFEDCITEEVIKRRNEKSVC